MFSERKGWTQIKRLHPKWLEFPTSDHSWRDFTLQKSWTTRNFSGHDFFLFLNGSVLVWVPLANSKSSTYTKSYYRIWIPPSSNEMMGFKLQDGPKNHLSMGWTKQPLYCGNLEKNANFEGSNMGSPENVHPVSLILQASMFRFKLTVSFERGTYWNHQIRWFLCTIGGKGPLNWWTWTFCSKVYGWVVVSKIFHPYLGKWSNLTSIFQMGWNHQLVFFSLHQLFHFTSFPIVTTPETHDSYQFPMCNKQHEKCNMSP